MRRNALGTNSQGAKLQKPCGVKRFEAELVDKSDAAQQIESRSKTMTMTEVWSRTPPGKETECGVDEEGNADKCATASQ